MMGSSNGSYHWRGGTAVGDSFTNDGATKNKCTNQPNKRLDNFRQEEEDGRMATGQQTRGVVGPGNDVPVTDDDNNTNNHDNAASSYGGGVGGRYKDDANSLAAASRRWIFGRFGTWN